MTSYDVIRFSAVPFALDTEKIQRQIPVVENSVFNSILGRAWRTALVADIIDNSSEPNWAAGSYSSGDIVRRGGVYWIATATTSTEPGAGAVGWDYAPRFTTNCNQLLYDNGLAAYLAGAIIQGCIAFSAMEINAEGVVRKKGDNFDPAELKELDRFSTAWEAWKQVALSNLHYYITDNSDGCSFPLYEGGTSTEVLRCCPRLGARWADETTETRTFTRPRFMVTGGDNCLEDDNYYRYFA